MESIGFGVSTFFYGNWKSIALLEDSMRKSSPTPFFIGKPPDPGMSKPQNIIFLCNRDGVHEAHAWMVFQNSTYNLGMFNYQPTLSFVIFTVDSTVNQESLTRFLDGILFEVSTIKSVYLLLDGVEYAYTNDRVTHVELDRIEDIVHVIISNEFRFAEVEADYHTAEEMLDSVRDIVYDSDSAELYR